MKKNSATTLIEILIAMTVFVLIMVVVMGGFTLVYSNWKKQKEYADLVSKAQRAMSFMTAELKYAKAPFVPSGSDQVRFSDTADDKYWYWLGDGDALGNASVLYRGRGDTVIEANDTRQELVTSIVENPGTPGNSIFVEDSGCVRIELTLSSGHYNYSLASGACCRN